jgi:hypothetical protein
MDKVIVYLDDPAYAQQRMPAANGAPTHWVLVACAPRMTHRISKWVSHSARENWRLKWADKLFGQVIPQLQARGDAVTPVLARGPLPELTRMLMAEHGTARVLDVRRPKAPEGPASQDGWPPNTLMGMGALLLLALD